ncbi:MAG: hypothetical protein R3C18_18585 [Planctomycetaceae bacterium]
MDLSFDVNPDLDLAIGTEVSFDEAEGEFDIEDFATLGVDPLDSTGAKPGSEEKVRMLAARYAAGVPLWHDGDCYDHGPTDGLLDLASDEFADEDEDVEEEL